jgi:hypothetical protein
MDGMPEGRSVSTPDSRLGDEELKMLDIVGRGAVVGTGAMGRLVVGAAIAGGGVSVGGGGLAGSCKEIPKFPVTPACRPKTTRV